MNLFMKINFVGNFPTYIIEALLIEMMKFLKNASDQELGTYLIQFDSI